MHLENVHTQKNSQKKKNNTTPNTSNAQKNQTTKNKKSFQLQMHQKQTNIKNKPAKNIEINMHI